MSLKTLDRTLWSYAEALDHVQTVTVARRTVQAARLPAEPPVEPRPWSRPQDPALTWKAEAETEFLVALRDGDLHAQGRYTEERTNPWSRNSNDTGFGLHSGYHTSVRPEQWREGTYSWGRLTARDWEFIDIRMPRFMVKAIWPDFVPEVATTPTDASAGSYTTPYLDLMQAAIAEFNLTTGRQEKKDCLVAWFLEHEIEGEPLSQKLADVMATLIRQPAAQRGGGKRVVGPDLRRVG